jgi:hypothetical protein
MNKEKKLEVAFEFLIFGLIFGVLEDLLAVYFTTGQSISWTTVLIVLAIALPFAILGEIFADNVDFISIYKKLFKKK